MIGTRPLYGFGLQFIWLKDTNSPSKLASWWSQSARIDFIYSSILAPRRLNGIPIASNSSFNHPAPIPNSKRPSVKWSIVANCFAKTTGFRCGRTNTPVIKRSLVVIPPIKVSQDSGSGQGISAFPGRRPFSLYGYLVS